MRAHRLLGLLRRAVRDPEVTERLARLEKELRASKRNERRLLRHALRTRESLDALLRAAYVDPATAEYPQRIALRRFGIQSQNAEDGVVLELLRSVGIESRTFVEIGCGNNGGNSGFLARDLGWRGLMLDGSEAALAEARLRFNDRRVRFVHAYVSAENIDSLLAENGVAADVDFLSIDIDGNDIWVWEALSACRPRVVACEFNAFWGPEKSVAVPYDPDWRYPSGSDYFGASLAAFAAMGRRKGFRLVAVEPRGANAFFVRDDLAPELPTVSPAEAFHPLLSPSALYDEIGPRRAEAQHERSRALEERVARESLPLVAVD